MAVLAKRSQVDVFKAPGDTPMNGAFEWRISVFPIAKARSSRWGWFYALLAAVLGLPALLAFLLLFWPNHVRFEAAATGLTIRGSVYGRTIPADAIRRDGLRRLTVADTPGIYPSQRTNGIGLPDYLAGWFQLNDGRSALLFVTDWSRTIVVPTTAGYDLVLSPDDPDALVTALHSPPPPGAAPGHFPWLRRRPAPGACST